MSAHKKAAWRRTGDKPILSGQDGTCDIMRTGGFMRGLIGSWGSCVAPNMGYVTASSVAGLAVWLLRAFFCCTHTRLTHA
jgi:hypothetical protein